MKLIQNILCLVIIALASNAIGQKTDWEIDYLQGKVKKYELFSYDFDISDSINHEEFMNRFYHCDFDVDRMIRFADSINNKIAIRDRSFYWYRAYDSLGYQTRLGDNYYYNEYDSQGRLSKMIIDNGTSSNDTISYSYKFDEAGRLVEERRQDRIEQWTYDSEGRLLEHKVIEDETMQEQSILKYDKHGVLRKSERSGFPSSDSKIYCEYDSKGNVIFEKIENDGIAALTKMRTKYKYDKNDSIIKKTMHKTRWYNFPKQKDDFWEEMDSLGNVTRYSNYKVVYSKKKEKTKSEWLFTRNEAGGLINEKCVHKNQYGTSVSLGEYDDAGRLIKDVSLFRNDTIPRVIIKYKYDELGRIIEKEIMNYADSRFRKEVTRYYKDTDFRTYYATYHGDNEDDYAFSHESLFFFDEHGNCIAHIQWMPTTQNWEYYFNVFRYEYYE